jgi:type V secretory pathway adhesin AidA
MKKTASLLSFAVLLLVGAGCSGTATTSVATPPAPTAARPAPAPDRAPAPTPAPAPAPTSGPRLTIAVSGDAAASGTYPANCQYAFPMDRKGVVFSAMFAGFQLSLADDSQRTPGVQSGAAGKWILNGPARSYVSTEGAQVTFGPDMKWATVKGDFASGVTLQGPKVHVEGRFDCE